MPPEVETPVAEVPAESPQEAVAEPAAPASPEAEGAPAPETGDVTGETDEGPSLVEALKGLTAAELDNLVESLPEETRKESSFLRELERRAEQRGTTRRQEEEQARAASQDGLQQLEQLADQAEQWLHQSIAEPAWELEKLQKMAADPDFLDPQKFKQTVDNLTSLMAVNVQSATGPIRAGERAKAARQQRAEVVQFLQQEQEVFGALSDEEYDKLTKASYRDAQRGGAQMTQEFMRIYGQRLYQKGLTEGREKGLKDKQAQAEIIDKIKQVQAVKNGTAPRVNGSKSAADLDTSKEARNRRLAFGGATEDDRRWQRETYPG